MKLSTILAVLAVALAACITCTGCNELKASAKPVAQTNSLQAADVAIGKVSSKLDDLQASVGGVQLIATTIHETAVATRENTEAIRNDIGPKVDNIDRNVADVLDVVGKIAEQLGPGTDAVPHKAAPAKAAPVPVPIDAPPNDPADQHTAKAGVPTLQFDGRTVTIDEFLAEHFKGRIWSHPGRTIDDELARHGVGGDVLALDVKTKERLHSAIHERESGQKTVTKEREVVKTAPPAKAPASSCPGGVCPVPQQQYQWTYSRSRSRRK